MDKDKLVKLIRDWVKNDTEIRELQKEQNVRRIENKRLSLELIEIMHVNQIDCFDILNGKIMYSKKNVKKPISKKNLLDILSRYYEEDIEKASSLNSYIFDNRENTVKETITRRVIV